MIHALDLTLHFTADRAFYGPTFNGSMLRGAFGAALKRTVCVMRLRDCTGCPLEHACIYTTIFETRPQPDGRVMRKYDRVPHPFLIAVPPPQSRAEPRASCNELVARMRLFGEAARAFPFVLKAFEEAAQAGFGAARVPHRLTHVTGDDGSCIWKSGENFRPVKSVLLRPNPLPRLSHWQFISPVRLKRDGKLLGPDSLTAPDLCMAVVRRLGLLTGFYGAADQQLDFTALKEAAGGASITLRTLHWQEIRRFSSRQKMDLNMGGLMGEITLDHGGDAGLAEALAFAPMIHVGKGATMGLGEVAIMAAESTGAGDGRAQAAAA